MSELADVVVMLPGAKSPSSSPNTTTISLPKDAQENGMHQNGDDEFDPWFPQSNDPSRRSEEAFGFLIFGGEQGEVGLDFDTSTIAGSETGDARQQLSDPALLGNSCPCCFREFASKEALLSHMKVILCISRNPARRYKVSALQSCLGC